MRTASNQSIVDPSFGGADIASVMPRPARIRDLVCYVVLEGPRALQGCVRARAPITGLSGRYDYSSAKIRYAAMDATSAEMSIAVIGSVIHRLVRSIVASGPVAAVIDW